LNEVALSAVRMDKKDCQEENVQSVFFFVFLAWWGRLGRPGGSGQANRVRLGQVGG
jgi:hypothetical protein